MNSISKNQYELYPQSLLTQEVQKLSTLPNQNKFLICIDLANLIVKNAALTIREFHQGNMKSFDPLVRDRCCQIHAMHIVDLFHDEEIKKETEILQIELKDTLKKINYIRNKPFSINDQDSFQEVLDRLELIDRSESSKVCEKSRLNASRAVSSKIALLCAGHLLTFCTTLHQPRRIDYAQIQAKTSKHLPIDLIKQVVSLARTTFSESSSNYIQKKAVELSLGNLMEERLSKIRHFVIYDQQDSKDSLATALTATCMFYNMKTILLEIRKRGILVLLKEFRTDKQAPMGIFLRVSSTEEKFIPISREEIDPKEYVIVFKGQVSQDITQEKFISYVLQKSLDEIILEEVSLMDQFSFDNDIADLDKEAIEEILYYRTQSKTGEKCFRDIVHVYSNKVGEENIQ